MLRIVIFIIATLVFVQNIQHLYAVPAVGARTKSSKQIVDEIRQFMIAYEVVGAPIQAYIIPCTDEHQNEIVSEHDKRLQFVTGFTGSNGEACITTESAAFWTDSRYHVQAEQQLDTSIWTIMKEGKPTVPDIIEWLCDELPPNSRIGVDPLLILATRFAGMNERLMSCKHEFVPITNNLVHLVWNDTRPSPTFNDLVPVEAKHSGQPASKKLDALLAELRKLNVKSQVVTELDEVAWLLNLRGSDLKYSPLFFAYLIIMVNERKIFFHLSKSDRFNSKIYNHFYTEGIDVEQMPYDVLINIREVLRMTNGKMLLSRASYAISNSVPVERRLEALSPIVLLKAVKNEVEVSGMRAAHLRDGAAVVRYLHWLDCEIGSNDGSGGKYITEISGANQLDAFRNETKENTIRFKQQLSFETISAVGEHAALPHYVPTPETDKQITQNEIYLIDSGAQYLDGTTDITRTVHFGKPTEKEIDAFTRVLKGFIAIQTARFPPGAETMFLDGLARRSLWDAGMDFHHATGHGIGAYLNVHEYPPTIQSFATGHGLQKNMFTTNEPGYYKNGSFGIRIEDVIQVVDLPNSEHTFGNKGSLCFQDITMVPIQRKLMNVSMLADQEIAWLNEYHQNVRDNITPHLGDDWNAVNWLHKETAPIARYAETPSLPAPSEIVSTTHGDISPDNTQT